MEQRRGNRRDKKKGRMHHRTNGKKRGEMSFKMQDIGVDITKEENMI